MHYLHRLRTRVISLPRVSMRPPTSAARLPTIALLAIASAVLAPDLAAQESPRQFAERGPRFLLAKAENATPRKLDVAKTPVLRRRLSLDFDSVPLGDALKRVATEAGLELAFSDAVIPLSKRVHLRAEGITVAAALTELLVDVDVDVLFSTSGEAVLIRQSEPPQEENSVITGEVTDEFGQPIEGANVTISEMGISVGTNAKGVYLINLPDERVSGQTVTLRARSLGHVPQTRSITITSGTHTYDFVMKRDMNRLAEIVVTGVTAGTEQRDLPFTVSHVDAEQMPVPGADPLTQLQGKIPGVNIATTSGRPGSQPSVILRGPQSINGEGRGQEPLYIVDGVEMSDGLPDINPNDIESVEVVKGAAAASLYGSRAGNGVIQITTKSGRGAGEGVHFTTRLEYGASDIEGEYKWSRSHFLTMDETRTGFCLEATNCTVGLDLQKEAFRSNNVPGDFSLPPVRFDGDGGINRSIPKVRLRGMFGANRWPVAWDPVASTVTNGQSVSATIDASGKVGTTNFFASANGFVRDGSIRFQPGYDRKSLRLNLDQEITDRWTFGFRTYYSTSTSNGGTQENAGPGFVRLTRQPGSANLLATDDQGRLYIRSSVLSAGGTYQNPLYLFQATLDRDTRSRFVSAFNSRYSPFSWADIDGSLNFSRSHGANLYREDVGFRTLSESSTNDGELSRSTFTSSSVNGSVNASLHRNFFTDLNARLTLRSLYEEQQTESFNARGLHLVAPGLKSLNGIVDPNSIRIGSSESTIRAIGLMSGADLTYKGRYIVSTLVRRDGSSLFGENNRWATYGRGAVAWRVSEEGWWVLPALNDLKLRASIGSAGGRPRYSAQYETFSVRSDGTLSASTLGNKNLRPETVVETEIGVDGELLHRFGFTINYAHSVSRDQILPVPPSVSSGFVTQWQNAGTLENKTWEASLNIPILNQRNLSWSMRLNYDRNRAEITQLDVPPFFGGPGLVRATSMFRYAEGERYGTMYGRHFVMSCSQLPDAFRSQCGGPGSAFQKNSDGFIVWVGAGNSVGDGIKNNLWQAVLPGCSAGTSQAPGAVVCESMGGTVTAPWGVATSWGMPMIIRDSTGSGRQMALGNALPKFRASMAHSFTYRRFSLYGLLAGNFGRKVYNYARGYAYGDLLNREVDQLGKSVEDAKPLGYYWRAPAPDNSSGVGGLYDDLGPNSWNVENASYIKLRELALSYNVGSVRGFGDWSVTLIGRNLKTFTNYKGFDPEVGYAGGTSGSALVNALDYGTYPALREFTVSVGARF